jgi:hypothetical protein
VVVGKAAAELPVVVGKAAAELPVVVARAVAELPVVVGKAGAELPVVVATELPVVVSKAVDATLAEPVTLHLWPVHFITFISPQFQNFSAPLPFVRGSMTSAGHLFN